MFFSTHSFSLSTSAQHTTSSTECSSAQHMLVNYKVHSASYQESKIFSLHVLFIECIHKISFVVVLTFVQFRLNGRSGLLKLFVLEQVCYFLSFTILSIVVVMSYLSTLTQQIKRCTAEHKTVVSIPISWRMKCKTSAIIAFYSVTIAAGLVNLERAAVTS